VLWHAIKSKLSKTSPHKIKKSLIQTGDVEKSIGKKYLSTDWSEFSLNYKKE